MILLGCYLYRAIFPLMSNPKCCPHIPQTVTWIQTHWLVWRPSTSSMTPFSCNLAPVYFKDCCFDFLFPFSSSFLSILMDLREFLWRHSIKMHCVEWYCAFPRRNEYRLCHSLSVEVIKAGLDVGVIVVDLVLIERCLGVKGTKSLLELHQFPFSPLPVAPLVSNVLLFQGTK